MKEFYERIWEGINGDDKTLNFLWRRWLDEKRKTKILTMIKPFLKNKCLEVGCANGLVTNELNKIVPTEGIDICSLAIKSAKKKYPDIKFKVGSVENLPYSDNNFDSIFAGEIIEHVSDTIKMFEELRRVLKPNGNLIIITPEFNFIKNLIITFFYWEQIYYPKGEHLRFYTKNSLKKILKECKFKVIFDYTEKYYRLIPRVMIVIAKKNKMI